MKRSEINKIIQDSIKFMDSFHWKLPEWAHWGIYEWRKNQGDCEQIFNHSLGWDITDFGSGDFSRRGLFLFTMRNGLFGKTGKSYAEKIMIVREMQETPFHFHRNKMEDIINRGGGNLVFQLYKSDGEEDFSNDLIDLYLDDRKISIRGGDYISLKPGQSLCLQPYVYHRFFAQDGMGDVLTGEVSQVNDDIRDNRFYESIGRFPVLSEDEEPFRYLIPDYPRLKEKLV